MAWHGAGFARVRGIAAVAMVTGHSIKLYSPFQFDLSKKNSICVWSPWTLCGARGAHTLASPCQATWEPGPKSRLLLGLQGQGISTAGISASSAQMWVLGEPLKGSPPPKSEGVKEKKKAPFCSSSFFSRVRALLAGGKLHTLMKQKGARKESRYRAHTNPCTLLSVTGGSSNSQKPR